MYNKAVLKGANVGTPFRDVQFIGTCYYYYKGDHTRQKMMKTPSGFYTYTVLYLWSYLNTKTQP